MSPKFATEGFYPQNNFQQVVKVGVGEGMQHHFDVFSDTHAQEKWKSQDYQIASNTKDIKTKISAIHHKCQLVSVATVIYSGAEIHSGSLSASLLHTHILTFKPRYHVQQLSSWLIFSFSFG